MKNTLLLSTLLLFQSVGFAKSTACPTPTLKNFAVYSASDIDVQQSDYTGPAGAGGKVIATNFEFNAGPNNCFALAAGGDITVISAAVKGSLEGYNNVRLHRVGVASNVSSKSADLNSSSVSGTLSTRNKPTLANSSAGRKTLLKDSFVVSHMALNRELFNTSETLADMTPTMNPFISGDSLTIEAGPGLNVVQISAADIDQAKNITIAGILDSKVIINVKGSTVLFTAKNVQLSGQIRPSNITWNFVDATDLLISYTQNPTLGLPGIIYAQSALVEFHEGLVTGALYVAKLVTSVKGSSTLNAGQVNYEAPGDQPGCPAPIPPAFPE